MATIQPAVVNIVGGVTRYTYTPMTQTGSDVSVVLDGPDFRHKEVQVLGTFGAAGNVAIEGSLDGGTTWAVVNDVQGNLLNVTTAKIEKIQETCAALRARVTAGDGTTSLTVVFVFVSGGAYGS